MSELEYGTVEPEYDENGDLIEYYAIRPNKTQIKKDIAEIARIAEELTQLTTIQLQEMQLPEKIEQEIGAAKKMPATKSARKRQLKFITAQLRNIELDAVMDNLDRLKSKSAHGIREHHQAETWRDRLIADGGNDVLTELVKQFPDVDRQYLRQLQRNAEKEAKTEKPPKSARMLYQYLKELISE